MSAPSSQFGGPWGRSHVVVCCVRTHLPQIGATGSRRTSRVRKRLSLSHAKSYGRYRPTAYRLDMRVTGQDSLWPSNMSLYARRNQPRLSRRRHDAVAPYRRYRQLATPPLWNRNLYDPSATGNINFALGSGNLHRGDDRP